MNTYLVSGVYKSLVGDGYQAGQKSAFVTFQGCNLWSGLPKDRPKGEGACSRWCDAEFAGGEALSTDELLTALDATWPPGGLEQRWVRLTGGEPMLQLDVELLQALRAKEWRVAVETNGTLAADFGDVPIDHLVVSPKLGSATKLTRAHELKVVVPGAAPPDPGWTDDAIELVGLEGRWQHKYIVPQDPIDEGSTRDSYLVNLGGDRTMAGIYKLHLGRCVAFVDRHPDWKLSTQQNKLVGIP
jgi:organic radical activating enzyme